MENQTSGQTDNNLTEQQECTECRVRHMGSIEDIYESEYDEDMDTYYFTLGFYNGETQVVGISPKHIKEMMLFMRKEEAHQTYIKHLIKR